MKKTKKHLIHNPSIRLGKENDTLDKCISKITFTYRNHTETPTDVDVQYDGDTEVAEEANILATDWQIVGGGE